MTGSGGLCYDRYPAGEWMMRIGDADAPAILFIPPLFEELNRTRALIGSVMRRLAARGFGCWLPDLPGTGESDRRLDECDWDDWRSAARAAGEATGAAPAVASLRGGCLLDDAVAGGCYWRFAPAEGASLARDLERAGLVAGGGTAGYRLSEPLAGALRAATPLPVEPLRIAKLDGPALWRRSEPANSPELAEAMANDIAGWIRQCASC